MVVAKKFVLRRKFNGLPKKEDVFIQFEELPPLKEGGELMSSSGYLLQCRLFYFEEFLAEAVYLSVDPYMRSIAEILEPGDTLVGAQVAKYVCVYV